MRNLQNNFSINIQDKIIVLEEEKRIFHYLSGIMFGKKKSQNSQFYLDTYFEPIVYLIRQEYRVKSNNLSKKTDIEPTMNSCIKILMCSIH